MKTTIRATGKILNPVSRQLLGNNIECYENTIPCMLSDRLRNAKFAGPANHQTGIAPEWEPIMNNMQGFSCQLVPGMYLSGNEAQLVHNYREKTPGGIQQVNINVREGEVFEVEVWARAQHAPVNVAVELVLPERDLREDGKAELMIDLAHWHRKTCQVVSPGTGKAALMLRVPGQGRVVFDQIHMRPVGESHVSQALLDAFDQFPCPVLRFPGGCASCTYHWEHGIGPVHRRPVTDDPVFKYKIYYDFGTDEYLDLCIARNMKPCITLNTTTATPDDAAAWASYIRNRYLERNLPVPEAYFMIGNENYGTWEIGHMTGDMYVAQVREFAPAVKKAYPEAKIAALGEYRSEGLWEKDRTEWRSLVLEQVDDLIDMLVVTRYSGSKDADDMNQNMHQVADHVTRRGEEVDQQIKTLQDAGSNSTIGIVEWNYWTRATHNDHAGFYEPNDIRHCLFAAGLLNTLSGKGDIIETVNYYSLVNTMGMIHVHDGQVVFSDVTHVLKWYDDALPGEALQLDIDAPMLTDISPCVQAACLRNEKATYAFLVNYHASEDVIVNLENMGTVAHVQGLRGHAILQPVEQFDPEHAETTVTLPPMSMVRVTLR